MIKKKLALCYWCLYNYNSVLRSSCYPLELVSDQEPLELCVNSETRVQSLIFCWCGSPNTPDWWFTPCWPPHFHPVSTGADTSVVITVV